MKSLGSSEATRRMASDRIVAYVGGSWHAGGASGLTLALTTAIAPRAIQPRTLDAYAADRDGATVRALTLIDHGSIIRSDRVQRRDKPYFAPHLRPAKLVVGGGEALNHGHRPVGEPKPSIARGKNQ